jgi:hypothetical protein
MVRYMKVTWHHDFPDEPIYLFSEIQSGREVRKVEVYADDHMDFAGEESCSGSTILSETLMPTIEEIAADPQFTPTPITREEFEATWRAAGAN